MKNRQEDYSTTETVGRKRHEDNPASVAYVISTVKCVMQQMHSSQPFAIRNRESYV